MQDKLYGILAEGQLLMTFLTKQQAQECAEAKFKDRLGYEVRSYTIDPEDE